MYVMWCSNMCMSHVCHMYVTCMSCGVVTCVCHMYVMRCSNMCMSHEYVTCMSCGVVTCAM